MQTLEIPFLRDIVAAAPDGIVVCDPRDGDWAVRYVNPAFEQLTGYTAKGLESQIAKKTSFEAFFDKAPKLNPARKQITGVICGYRVDEIEDPLMQQVRYLDKLVDELAKGKAMEKILRK